jgi:MFS family permease
MADLHNKHSFQWAQLLTVTGAHFIADMFVGMIPGILPAVQEHFRLDISQGTLLMGTMFISANFIQVFTGHLRSNKTRPLFLYIGIVLAAVTCFFALVSVTDKSIFILLAMIVASGLGVGSIHPESLRAIHTLNKIRGSAAIAFFMSGGIAGFASGGYIAPVLVERFGHWYACLRCGYKSLQTIIRATIIHNKRQG